MAKTNKQKKKHSHLFSATLTSGIEPAASLCQLRFRPAVPAEQSLVDVAV